MYAESTCYSPEWEVIENHNSAGATQYEAVYSVQECLDYCGSQDSCVAVDVDLTKQPPTCWPHFSAEHLLQHNSYTQQGTNQYRFKLRCADPITGLTCLIVTSPRRGFVHDWECVIFSLLVFNIFSVLFFFISLLMKLQGTVRAVIVRLLETTRSRARRFGAKLKDHWYDK